MTETISAKEYRELQFQVTPQMKYRNQITVVDGISFDSKKEADYYGKLKLLKASGEVIDFQMQVKYYFELNGVKMGFYKADFVVEWKTLGTKVVDVKGMKTSTYSLKKKMMLAFHGIKIFEV